MKFRPPHFANTVLFRISALFLLLLGISLGAYYMWIENTVFNPYQNEAEENWYLNLAEAELDSLALELVGIGDDLAANDRLAAYGEVTGLYGAEAVAFDPGGNYIWSTTPDSLRAALPATDGGILAAMSGEDWDFGSYPDSLYADAYINRIFDVNVIRHPETDEPLAYLALSFRPTEIFSDNLNQDSQLIDTQEKIFKVLMGMLIYSSLTALLIMMWTGRRIQRLSTGVEKFAAGDFSHRVQTRSTDEIGNLGRNFNGMAKRIESMIEELRHKEQFQRQLVANVSHDLRTPMASLRGYVETLQMPGGGDPAQRERYLRIIATNIDHLERLVEHMMVLSRFDSGQAVFRMESFPIAELVDGVLLRFEGLAAEKGIELELDASPEVEHVHADPLQIGQVMQNLIENGIKFNRPAGKVTVALSRDGQSVMVEVRDTGRGIPATDLPHIFERFFTGDESRTREVTDPGGTAAEHRLGQSSGLGLSIASKIVAEHNSVLRVVSVPDEGSVFRFRLEHAEHLAQDLSVEA